jgi:hypothetical protein
MRGATLPCFWGDSPEPKENYLRKVWGHGDQVRDPILHPTCRCPTNGRMWPDRALSVGEIARSGHIGGLRRDKCGIPGFPWSLVPGFLGRSPGHLPPLEWFSYSRSLLSSLRWSPFPVLVHVSGSPGSLGFPLGLPSILSRLRSIRYVRSYVLSLWPQSFERIRDWGHPRPQSFQSHRPSLDT